MRFEEAHGSWQNGDLTQEEAARLLGICERTVRRYIDWYEDEELEGLIDKRQFSRCATISSLTGLSSILHIKVNKYRSPSITVTR